MDFPEEDVHSVLGVMARRVNRVAATYTIMYQMYHGPPLSFSTQRDSGMLCCKVITMTSLGGSLQWVKPFKGVESLMTSSNIQATIDSKRKAAEEMGNLIISAFSKTAKIIYGDIV